MLYHRRVVVAVALVVMMASTGCTYLKNRGNDASDVFEIGLTVTPRCMPVFALYWNPFNMLPFGYANAHDLILLGWSDRQAGALTMYFHGWGAFAWGSQQLGIGRHDMPGADGEPEPLGWSVTEPGHTYTTGFVGAWGQNGPPGRTFGECPKLLSLGWIGLYANCSFLDFADFILGWTTLDIGHDDAPDYLSDPSGGMRAIMAASPGVNLEKTR